MIFLKDHPQGAETDFGAVDPIREPSPKLSVKREFFSRVLLAAGFFLVPALKWDPSRNSRRVALQLIISFFIILISSVSAHAHIGHLGELAGHSHWIAIGAGVVAAALAAALGKRKLDEEKDETIEDADEQPDAEAAGA